MGLLKSFMRKVALAAAVVVGKNVLSKSAAKEEAPAATPAKNGAGKPRTSSARRKPAGAAKTGTKAKPAAKPAAAAASKTETKPKTAKPRTATSRSRKPAKPKTASPVPTPKAQSEDKSAGPGTGSTGS